MNISENLNRIINAKSDIKTAIEAKGQTIDASATIDTYASKIDSISTGNDASWVDLFAGVDTSVTLPGSVTKIRDYAFYDLKTNNTIDLLHTKITEIGNTAFGTESNNTGYLNIVNFPPTLTTIGDSAFQNSLLMDVSFPSALTTIGDSAFYGCNLINVDLSHTQITKIPNSCFSGNASLQTISFPSSLKEFNGYNIFQGCISITDIYYRNIDISISNTYVWGDWYNNYCGKANAAKGTNKFHCLADSSFTASKIDPNNGYLFDPSFGGFKLVRDL